jgi:hypothetical protein
MKNCLLFNFYLFIVTKLHAFGPYLEIKIGHYGFIEKAET